MIPTLSDVTDYLGADSSYEPDEVRDSLSAERASQYRACRAFPSRSVTVDTTNGGLTLTGLPGVFSTLDLAARVEGPGLPVAPNEAAVIVGVSTDGATATLSAAASATGSGVLVTVVAPDLVEALYRRVAHALALRSLPLGIAATLSEMSVATNRVGGLDAEVARLEAPWRRLVVG